MRERWSNIEHGNVIGEELEDAIYILWANLSSCRYCFKVFVIDKKGKTKDRISQTRYSPKNK